MTTIRLAPATSDQLAVLQNLWQLYVHDFTDYLDEDVNEQGLFTFDFDFNRYFTKPGYWAYIAYVGDQIAGFSLVSSRVMRGTKPGRYIDEFFILRRYRRRGIGRSIAFQTFETHTGYWEVTEIANNTPAQAFWRRVIGDYSNERYEEVVLEKHDNEVMQMFDSSTW